MEHWNWLIGLFLGLLGSLAAACNKTFWKLGYNRAEEGRSSWKCHLIGFAALAINPPLDLLALTFAPQTLFSATAGTGIVFQFILSWCILGERPTLLDEIAAMFIFIGCTGVAISEAGVKDADETYESLIARFNHPDFIAFAAGSAVLMLLLAYCCFSTTHPQLKKFSYGALGGCIGGLYFLLKTALLLVGLGLSTDPTVWHKPMTYVVLVIGVLSTVGGVTVLNQGLKQFDAIIIAPMYQAFLVIMGTVSGALFFRELEALPLPQRALFWVSLSTLLAGIACTMLSVRPERAEVGVKVKTKALSESDSMGKKGYGGGEKGEGMVEDKENLRNGGNSLYQNADSQL